MSVQTIYFRGRGVCENQHFSRTLLTFWHHFYYFHGDFCHSKNVDFFGGEGVWFVHSWKCWHLWMAPNIISIHIFISKHADTCIVHTPISYLWHFMICSLHIHCKYMNYMGNNNLTTPQILHINHTCNTHVAYLIVYTLI